MFTFKLFSKILLNLGFQGASPDFIELVCLRGKLRAFIAKERLRSALKDKLDNKVSLAVTDFHSFHQSTIDAVAISLFASHGHRSEKRAEELANIITLSSKEMSEEHADFKIINLKPKAGSLQFIQEFPFEHGRLKNKKLYHFRFDIVITSRAITSRFLLDGKLVDKAESFFDSLPELSIPQIGRKTPFIISHLK